MKPKFNQNKLRGRIKEIYGSEKEFSSAMELNQLSISKKLRSLVYWKQDEIIKAIELLDIPKEKIADYFFKIM